VLGLLLLLRLAELGVFEGVLLLLGVLICKLLLADVKEIDNFDPFMLKQ